MPKININGITREMTPEEVAEMEEMAKNMPEPEPTIEEKFAALQAIVEEQDAALIELASLA